MELKHVVVDGSNIATEGRSLPSLKQLDEAVRAFLAENSTEHVTVIVDATFGHRIDPKEKPEYEEAILAGELITPPAGAIGRGDKFVLQIADRANATILSNDSFQEFHGEYTWLFDEGRLVGGKPVPGVGWVFLLRTPVRGPTSRRAVRDARSSGGPAASADSRGRGRGRRRGAGDANGHGNAPVAPTAAPVPEPVAAAPTGAPRAAALEAINEPLPFIEFVANHPVGTLVDGIVDRFASHGAYILAGGARCYIGLKFMGDPAPRSAKDVLTLGETRPFAVHAFDTPRRGIDLAIVNVRDAGADVPADVVAEVIEEIEAEAEAAAPPAAPVKRAAKRSARSAGRGTRSTTRPPAETAGVGGDDTRNQSVDALVGADATGNRSDDIGNRSVATYDADNATRDLNSAEAGREEGAHDVRAVRVAATKAATLHSSTATKSAVDNAEEAPVATTKRAAAKKATSKKKATAKKAPAKKKTAAKKAPAKKAVAKKRAAAKKAPAKKAVAKKRAAAKKAPAKKKAAAKKAPAKKKAAAKKAPAKKKAAAKRSAKKAASRR